MLSLIVARTQNKVIGFENQMPWHLPRDLAWFRENTLGKPVIMGRKTYQSIGRLLPKRPNIILSRSNFDVEGAICVNNLNAAIDKAGEFNDEIMLIGGGELFKQALPLADKLYLTEIQADIAGDTFFEFDSSKWQIQQESWAEADEKNAFACRFLILTRRAK